MLSFEDLPNDVLVPIFDWLPSYKEKIGVSRVCSQWNYLSERLVRADLSRRFPCLPSSTIERSSISELVKLSEKMPSVYALLAKEYEVLLDALLDFVESKIIPNNSSDKIKNFLYHFARVSNISLLNATANEKEIFYLAAALGNKIKLMFLDLSYAQKTEREISILDKHKALIMAATYGQLDCLEYLDAEVAQDDKNRQEGSCSIYDQAFLFAAWAADSIDLSFKPFFKWDNLPCLKYLIEKHPDAILLKSIEKAIFSTCESDTHLPSFQYLCETMMEVKKKSFSAKSMKSLLEKSSPACKEYLIAQKRSSHRCVMS